MEIAVYIGKRSSDAAERFSAAIEDQFEDIREFPGTGRSCVDWHTGVRGLRRCAIRGFRNHLIFYAQRGNEVHVFRVVHGARDIPSILAGLLDEPGAQVT